MDGKWVLVTGNMVGWCVFNQREGEKEVKDREN
jgi:hypothetical protein